MKHPHSKQVRKQGKPGKMKTVLIIMILELYKVKGVEISAAYSSGDCYDGSSMNLTMTCTVTAAAFLGDIFWRRGTDNIASCGYTNDNDCIASPGFTEPRYSFASDVSKKEFYFTITSINTPVDIASFRCKHGPTGTDELDYPVRECVDCTVPTVANGQVNTTAEKVVEGTVVVVKCSTGYTLKGNAELTCQADQTWDNSIPTCTENGNGASYVGAIGGGVGGGVGGIVVITIVIIIIRRRMQAVDVEIMDCDEEKVKSTITSHKDGVYLVEFTPTLAGLYTIKISIGGKAIPGSPLSVNIGAAHASKAWYTSGLGIQQRGVRVNTKAKFKVHTKGVGDKVECEVISPAGRNVECEIKQSEKEVGVYECHYVPLEEGRYVINIIVDEQESSFKVKVVPEKTSKLGAYGLKGGVVNQLVCFTVESSAMDDKDQTKSEKTQEDADENLITEANGARGNKVNSTTL